MNILILGPQGSGKGTQAELLRQKFDLLYFEIGGILRELAKSDPEIDRLINKEGRLLPDDQTEEIFVKFLTENSWIQKKGLILDGFPRTLAQYNFVKDYLAKSNQKLDKAIFLDISEETSIRRLSARRTCAACGKVYNLLTNPPKGDVCGECGGALIQREDDKEEAIKRRLGLYRKRTEPLIKTLNKEGILIKVDGERPIKVIYEDILEKLKRF